MSRSYKKRPYCKQKSRFSQLEANRLVRRRNKVDVCDIREDYMADGNAYRREYPQWDVVDWVSYQTRNSVRILNEVRDDYAMKEESWLKYHYRK